MKNSIKWLILGLISILPFFYLTNSFFPFVFPKAVLIEGVAITVFVFWIIGRIIEKNNEFRVSFNKMFIAFALYIVAITISGFDGLAPISSFWGSPERATGIVFITCLFLLSLVMTAVLKNKDDWKDLFKAFFFSSVLFSIVTMLVDAQAFSILPGINSSNGLTFGNSTFAGIYLAFCFFIAFGLGLSVKEKSEKVLYFLGSFVLIINSILMGITGPFFGKPFTVVGEANTAFFSIVIGLLVIGFFHVYRLANKVNKRNLIALFIVFFVGAVTIFALPNGPVQKFISQSENAGPTRFIFWNIGFEAFQDRPVLGWGGETYNLMYAKHFDPTVLTKGYSGEYWVDRSHNMYIDEIATGGIVGFLTFSLFMAVMLWALFRKGIEKEESFMTVALFAALISLMIEGLMTFQVISSWFALAIIATYVSSNCFDSKNEIKSKDASFFGKTFLFAVIAIFVLALGMKYIVIKPFNTSVALSNLRTTPDPKDRYRDYKIINTSYIGRTSAVDQSINSVSDKMLASLNKGVSINTASVILLEIEQMDIILKNAIYAQSEMNIKLYVSGARLMAIATAVTNGEKQKGYYIRGINYVQGIMKNSPSNPLGPLYYKIMKEALSGKIGF